MLIQLFPVGMRLLWPGISVCSTWGNDTSRTIQVELQLQHINCINFSARDGPGDPQLNLVSKECVNKAQSFYYIRNTRELSCPPVVNVILLLWWNCWKSKNDPWGENLARIPFQSQMLLITTGSKCISLHVSGLKREWESLGIWLRHIGNVALCAHVLYLLFLF